MMQSWQSLKSSLDDAERAELSLKSSLDDAEPG
jgi:hypothetical protein